MRPEKRSPAHHTGDFAELVCSNSLRSDNPEANAVGILKAEMRLMDSLILAAADANKVPAGGALAVDREGFAATVTQRLTAHPQVEVVHREATKLPDTEVGPVLIATGPLTSDPLANALTELVGGEWLAFFDAIAPIVSKESIDFTKAWFQSRYDKGDGDDYINCPLDKEQYEAFIQALLEGEKVAFKEFEGTPYFEGCMPVEVMAERGAETLRFGPMKPVGLSNPHRGGESSYAVVQLRQDNALGTLWNMVGFQTKLTWPEQKRIFSSIPGLEGAEFMRLGALHRNTFLNGPKLLSPRLELKTRPGLFFAGQMTGVEGYVESAASGLLAGRFLAAESLGKALPPPPPETAHGALLGHVTGGAREAGFQPMNVNFGLFPPLEKRMSKKHRKAAHAQRALATLSNWLDANP